MRACVCVFVRACVCACMQFNSNRLKTTRLQVLAYTKVGSQILTQCWCIWLTLTWKPRMMQMYQGGTSSTLYCSSFGFNLLADFGTRDFFLRCRTAEGRGISCRRWDSSCAAGFRLSMFSYDGGLCLFAN